ncbi:MAG: hypothetical protein NW224_30005 [Leptolyngbyaceae cyanobacterium bins.302]|nr:hypothetical protein [Leptolyngbyaceae cyanobacterium bins.302]
MYSYLITIYLNTVLPDSTALVESIDPKLVQIPSQQSFITSSQATTSTTNQPQSPNTNQPATPTTNQSQSPATNQPIAPTNQSQPVNNQPATSTTNQSSNTPQSQTATNQSPYLAIYSTLITSGVVFLVGLLTFLYNRANLAESKRKERRESITKKLNEFYGPLNSYLKTIYEFNLFLKEGKPSDFRTLTHLLNPSKIYNSGEQVHLSDADKKIIAEIIDLESKVEELVTSKGGLIDDSNQADLLAKAIAHFRALRLAFSEEISGEDKRFDALVYPRSLDEAVQSRINALQDELQKISTPGWIDNLLKL